jgi:hypothetical protein
MKTSSFLISASLWTALSLWCASAFAQTYSIDWFTIDGGGGTSSGGQYSLSGTIGQPDAGKLSGGNYVLEGGFWGGLQGLGQPFLHISLSGTDVIISWTPSTPGFFLQESPTISPTAWSNSASGATNPASAPASGSSRFYRLSNH